MGPRRDPFPGAGRAVHMRVSPHRVRGLLGFVRTRGNNEDEGGGRGGGERRGGAGEAPRGGDRTGGGSGEAHGGGGPAAAPGGPERPRTWATPVEISEPGSSGPAKAPGLAPAGRALRGHSEPPRRGSGRARGAAGGGGGSRAVLPGLPAEVGGGWAGPSHRRPPQRGLELPSARPPAPRRAALWYNKRAGSL